MWMREHEEMPSHWHGIVQYDWNMGMYEVLPFPLFWIKRLLIRLRARLIYNFSPSKFERDLAEARRRGYVAGRLDERHLQR